MNCEVRALLDTWCLAHRKQVEAELCLTRWQLNHKEQAPEEMTQVAMHARAHAESLFEAVARRWP